MIVHDVVREVRPGSRCSHAIGRHLVFTFDGEEEANRYADRCNACNHTDGVRYVVEAIEELDPARARDDCPKCGRESCREECDKWPKPSTR